MAVSRRYEKQSILCTTVTEAIKSSKSLLINMISCAQLMIGVWFTVLVFSLIWLTQHYKLLNTGSSVCEREVNCNSGDVEERMMVLSDRRVFRGDDFVRRSTAWWEFGTKRRHVWSGKLVKRSPIAQFLTRITNSDQTGYWRSLHRAKKLNLSIGVHGLESIVSKGK